MTSVLFVCLGNICRSPLAEGIFRHLYETSKHTLPGLHIDSAGTGGWHTGNPPDKRSIQIAHKYGIDISQQKARQIRPEDLERFTHILAMDEDNLDELHRLADKNGITKTHIRLFLTKPNRNIPDPYYGGPDGFQLIYDLLNEGSGKLIRQLEQKTNI